MRRFTFVPVNFKLKANNFLHLVSPCGVTVILHIARVLHKAAADNMGVFIPCVRHTSGTGPLWNQREIALDTVAQQTV